MKKMAADPKTQEWWKIMMPIQVPLEGRAEGVGAGQGRPLQGLDRRILSGPDPAGDGRGHPAE